MNPSVGRLLRESARTVSFVPVPREPGGPGVRIACIGLAGTLGALGMLGHRRGGAIELLATGGHLLIPHAPSAVAALTGLLIHALWMVVWGYALVALTRQRRGLRASLAALVVAAAAFGTAVVVPAMLLGPVASLTTGERVLVHIVLALSLIIGTRLAFAGDARVVRRVSTGDEASLA